MIGVSCGGDESLIGPETQLVGTWTLHTAVSPSPVTGVTAEVMKLGPDGRLAITRTVADGGQAQLVGEFEIEGGMLELEFEAAGSEERGLSRLRSVRECPDPCPWHHGRTGLQTVTRTTIGSKVQRAILSTEDRPFSVRCETTQSRSSYPLSSRSCS